MLDIAHGGAVSRPRLDDFIDAPGFGPCWCQCAPPPEVAAGAKDTMPEISRSFMQAPDRARPDLDLTAAGMGKRNAIGGPRATEPSITSTLGLESTTVGFIGGPARLHG
ncbi:hypothetical protein V496_05798 [Pseudogymnoascus sp. VKM F-4515 (FW-2607)]|nr:hypothetical protein V496_05798 [Pseudogymnoascus sp. VKM F-4515 (FW-2607)]KFY96866.1 hypothetical protein V498_02459 [Pseudogymnoascus sp. VKM F-4517 (FW-2822)]